MLEKDQFGFTIAKISAKFRCCSYYKGEFGTLAVFVEATLSEQLEKLKIKLFNYIIIEIFNEITLQPTSWV